MTVLSLRLSSLNLPSPRRLPFLLSALALLCLAPAPSWAATTLVVPTTAYPTIQSAVSAARPGDTVLVNSGTYTGTGNVDIDFGGKDITVRSAGGAATTVIDCQGSASSPHRAFRLHSGETAASLIQGFTVRNGYAPKDDPDGYFGDGGGMSVSGATVSACVLTGNFADFGGGLYITGGTVTGYTFTNNSVRGSDGGGLSINGGIVTGCTITGNTGGGLGAAYATIINCTITNNSSNIGGGGASLDQGALMIGCTLTGNTATEAEGYGGGGGLYITTSSSSGAKPTAISCTISGNTSAGTSIV